jgi:Phosphotransferase enzyme family
MTVEARRRFAIEAALDVVRKLGVPADGPIVLSDANNTIVHLAPAPIVAKVGTSHFRDAHLESLERELAVAAYLADRGAPTVRPTKDVPPGPHRWRDLTVTLWQYAEPVRDARPASSESAAALTIVHRAMADFPGSLPSFAVELEGARRLLQPQRSPALAADDRRFVLSVVDDLQAELSKLSGVVYQPLHGSPHEGNWLYASEGLLLLDFETACRGPLEWDLAALDDRGVALFPDVDRQLITLLRRMRSVCVASKCWTELDRTPEVFEAAHVHLRLLRGEPLL